MQVICNNNEIIWYSSMQPYASKLVQLHLGLLHSNNNYNQIDLSLVQKSNKHVMNTSLPGLYLYWYRYWYRHSIGVGKLITYTWPIQILHL